MIWGVLPTPVQGQNWVCVQQHLSYSNYHCEKSIVVQNSQGRASSKEIVSECHYSCVNEEKKKQKMYHQSAEEIKRLKPIEGVHYEA